MRLFTGTTAHHRAIGTRLTRKNQYEGGLSVTGDAKIRPQFDPEEASAEPDGTATYTLEATHFEEQFDEEGQVRLVLIDFRNRTPMWPSSQRQAVDLVPQEPYQRRVPEVNIFDDGATLALDVTYDDFRPGDGPTDVIELAEVTIDTQEAELGATTDLSFTDIDIADADLNVCALEPRSLTLSIRNPVAVDVSFERTNERGLSG